MTEPRTRTYSWGDPAVTLAALPTMSGLEWLQAIQQGQLPAPPVLMTLGIDEFIAESGRVTLTLLPGEHLLNPIGTVHGGVIATMLDTVLGCVVQTTLAAGMGYTSLDLATRFLRPVTLASGLIRAEATVLARGSRTATAQADLLDREGRLLAHATSTCLLFPLTAPA